MPVHNAEDDTYYAHRYETALRTLQSRTESDCWWIDAERDTLCVNVRQAQQQQMDMDVDMDLDIEMKVLAADSSESEVRRLTWSDDSQWDEVSADVTTAKERQQRTEKCTHLSEMKICIQQTEAEQQHRLIVLTH